MEGVTIGWVECLSAGGKVIADGRFLLLRAPGRKLLGDGLNGTVFPCV